ncbi:MAG: response regulator [Micavibrio sp.]|nr:response regulator [Micavibrio sp.]
MSHILLAEDDSAMRDFLKLALEKAGFTVTCCEDGDEAYEELQKSHAENFDLLLADIVMPGMDGIELARKANKLFPDLKVMYITGFAAVAAQNNSEMNPNARVLSKPFHLSDLVKQVQETLKED